jgi:hypothetical protein
MPRNPRCHGIRADSPDPGQIGISIGIGAIPTGSGQNPGKFPNPGQAKSAKSGFNPGKSQFFDGQNRHCRLSATGPASAVPHLFLVLESIFQDPCPTLNGTRRVTMPQVLTRRSGPITLLAKRGHRHLQTQKLALVVITHWQEAEAHSLCSISLSHSLGTVAR